jgi:uncharacterized lipoprotein YmbA
MRTGWRSACIALLLALAACGTPHPPVTQAGLPAAQGGGSDGGGGGGGAGGM